MRFWMMAAAAIAIAVPASAQVTLTPGQRVTVTIAGRGSIDIGEPTRAVLGANGEAALSQVRALPAPPDGEIAPPPVPVQRNPKVAVPLPVPGQVGISFLVPDGRDSVLIVENGYDRAFSYRLRITLKGRTRPTDVCIVVPGKRAYEYWPDVIDSVELTEIELQDWQPGDPVTCR